MTPIESAMQTLKDEMATDTSEGSYAHSWHCNIAANVYDACGDVANHEEALAIGNRAASGFMKLCFGVETSD